MARVDGTTVDGNAGDDEGGGGSVPTIDIGSHIEAAAATADSRTSTGKRNRRTREQLEADGYYEGKDSKPGKPSAAPRKAGSLDVNSVQFALTGIHALLAAGMSAPELELTPTEAETVAKNIVAVARHYDLQQTAKATDWGNLIVALGVVYGGRFIRISARKKAEALAKRGATRANTGFVPTPPMTAPNQPQAMTPTKATPGMPPSRAKTDADLALLNEVEAFIAP
jgi:hypothetical protein